MEDKRIRIIRRMIGSVTRKIKEDNTYFVGFWKKKFRKKKK